jgi:plastocyanin
MAADRALDARAEHLAVVASNARFEPADLHVRVGDIVVVQFTNDDPVFHDWRVVGLANVDAGARPGQTQRIRFRADTPGTYRIECTVTGHAEAGMTGTLVVDPAD